MNRKLLRILTPFIVAAAALCGLMVSLLTLPDEAYATNHIVRMDEVMTGFNGNSKAQFIE